MFSPSDIRDAQAKLPGTFAGPSWSQSRGSGRGEGFGGPGLAKALPPAGKGSRGASPRKVRFRFGPRRRAHDAERAGGGGLRGGQDARREDTRRHQGEEDGTEARPAGPARRPPGRRPRPRPRDSADGGARAASPSRRRQGRAARRPPGPAGPRSPARRDLGSPGGSLTIFNSLCRQPVSPVTVSRPAARFRFRGCPPTSAGSASVRARKEAGRGAPRGSRAGPGLPRPRSRGTGGQGRSQGVGRERAVGTRCARRRGGRHLGSVTVNSCLRAGRRSDPFNAAASSERARSG